MKETLKTCVIWYDVKEFEHSEWESSMTTGTFGYYDGDSAASCISEFKRWARQTVYQVKITNVVIG